MERMAIRVHVAHDPLILYKSPVALARTPRLSQLPRREASAITCGARAAAQDRSLWVSSTSYRQSATPARANGGVAAPSDARRTAAAAARLRLGATRRAWASWAAGLVDCSLRPSAARVFLFQPAQANASTQHRASAFAQRPPPPPQPLAASRPRQSSAPAAGGSRALGSPAAAGICLQGSRVQGSRVARRGSLPPASTVCPPRPSPPAAGVSCAVRAAPAAGSCRPPRPEAPTPVLRALEDCPCSYSQKPDLFIHLDWIFRDF
ncbi:hypothetical protein PVAP13_6NG096603 [Panicum virgatum]|uniref:Uncharacterized protein n=1 Tax=Panicum virgatum TaxID=38727 RepID=A0A8T0QWB4_PANVG|nr:hypothetical protein PVAP13_6NG096603 [Panicum virgatum]